MPLTDAELQEATAKACKHCANGHKPKWRSDTQEWTHDIWHGPAVSHTICHAGSILSAFGSPFKRDLPQ